ncbi:hypothetical protein L1987_23890 [Smallanthus sonchifolius]|uniref:Uncharacterized protein n=1 Tax=Smallanthus sonchifolius TaxID=185202 RepID=A0ACB9IIP6_9ASTR|nr:hypothetical protein L1987_23890 [Smallanthus sonchifolius]
MGVKTAFIYGKVKEENYVCQPPGFEDCDHPDYVFKLDKALYGLHQAPRAWYTTLIDHLLAHGYTRGAIDQTLFVRKVDDDLILVQIYVDDIIFGSTNEVLCTEFRKVMENKFQMSDLGEMTFFLGLQVKKSSDGTLIHQGKYVDDILDKFKFADAQAASTPMSARPVLEADLNGVAVDQKQYRSMIGSLMYLTASRPDIMFVVCQCARYQVNPKMSHLTAVKLIMEVVNLAGRLQAEDVNFWEIGKFLGNVIWMQHQLLDYGLTFLNTVIFCDNEAAMLIVKNPFQHSKPKHIDIKVHFIRDSFERNLICLERVDFDNNVADIITKAFDTSRFIVLVESLKMIGFKD